MKIVEIKDNYGKSIYFNHIIAEFGKSVKLTKKENLDNETNTLIDSYLKERKINNNIHYYIEHDENKKIDIDIVLLPSEDNKEYYCLIMK